MVTPYVPFAEDWPHQTFAVTESLRMMAEGESALCVTSPTGGGKSRYIQRMCEHAVKNNKTAIVMSNRILLTNQLLRGLDKSGIRVGCRAAGFEAWTDSDASVQVISGPTEMARVFKRRERTGEDIRLHRGDWIFVDECFVSGTQVSTPTGQVAIEDVSVGDSVNCAIGCGVVLGTSKKTAYRLLKMEFSDGSEVTCTPNHRFFTDSGWIEAERILECSSIIACEENMSDLWSGIWSNSIYESENRTTECIGRKAMGRTKNLLSILLSEVMESDGRRRYSKENDGHADFQRELSKRKRRKWQRDAIYANGYFACIGRRLGAGTGRSDANQKSEQSNEISDILQVGHWQQESKSRNRNRRFFTCDASTARTRQKKGQSSERIRLVRASRFEPSSDVFVHNLQVSGHPSYFANGKLVHNCHLQKGDQSKSLLSEYRTEHGAVLFGISATPLGVSSIYDHLIVAGNNTSLRECGALVRAKCFEPAVVDLPKIRKSKTGVFTQGELESEMKEIWSQHVMGHVLKHWEKLNPDARPSLGMAPGVKESRWLAKEFFQRGINAAHIDAEGIYVNGEYKATTEQSDRDELFEMMKDGRVPIAWNRFVLREGLDLPWLYMLSLATPIASLLSFVQVVGRILRSHPSKTEALIADHCGVIRMHGSPNMDRDDDWRQYFHEQDETKITKDRNQKLTDPENKEPEPITCPACGCIRVKGPKCSSCGHEHPKSVRMVIQESGSLKPMTGDVYPRRKVSEYNDTQKKWNNVYFRMRNAKTPKTFSQALAFFKHEHGYYPPPDLKYMPKKSSDIPRKIPNVERGDLH